MFPEIVLGPFEERLGLEVDVPEPPESAQQVSPVDTHKQVKSRSMRVCSSGDTLVDQVHPCRHLERYEQEPEDDSC